MNVAASTLTCKGESFVGYCTWDDPAIVQNRLTQLTAAREPGIIPLSSPSDDPSWAILYPQSGKATGEMITGGMDRPLAAQSAGGLLTCEKPDGSLIPDAAVWLKDGRHLILERDPFGRVPLYWLHQGKTIWFASRLEFLLPLLQTPDISIPALYGYTCFSYVPTPLTAIAGIQAVPAGMRLGWQLEGDGFIHWTERSHQWRQFTEPVGSETEAVSHLQSLLKQAMARHLADSPSEPVGVALSGGLDSSIIAALLVQMGVSVRAYTLDFGIEETAEVPQAEQVARHLDIPLVRVKVTPAAVRRSLPATAAALDQPFGDAVTVPLSLLYQVASQEVGILFNGENGDQLFAGWTNKPMIAAEIYQAVTMGLPAESFEQQYLRTFHRLQGYERDLFQPDLLAQVQCLNPLTWLEEALDPQFSHTLLHRLRRANLMLKGAQNIQPRATALAQAHGLQLRSPFCDLPLAEWTFRLPGEWFLQGACEKYILKRAVEDWLPAEIVWRSKRGMGVPITAWCLSALWHDLGDWLNPERLRQEGLWQPDLAARLVRGELGTIQHRRIGESLWLLVMWQQWQSQVGGKTSSHRSFDHPFWVPSWLWRPYRKVVQWSEL